ncbi:MAG: hypothetical protein DSZ16_09775 [Candidatus Thioglobus sp.]|nr:MAG: hypothetical protein DSZ13_02015 [Candidatus Thioglobus sp.]RUM78726.1 MAG: hypothetical protein DSZ16_09775 [Candidatus Thioglobus sp.]RUM79480.1 MAG: hypothetical protein DSZ14_03720 [Candidatus Thioglobus sp.]
MFDQAIKYWGSNEFPQYFKQAVQSLELGVLPLKDCCNHNAVIDQATIEPIILSSHETKDSVEIKTGVFFCEVLSGCACSDDASQAKILENSYCELTISLDKNTKEASYSSAFSAS